MGKVVYFSTLSESKIERDSGILRGVSVITAGEAQSHGLFIDHTTLKQVKDSASLFPDGIPIKVNHGTGFEMIVGAGKNFNIQGDQVRADIHLLKSHDLTPQLVEVAERFPKSIGLSLRFECSREEIDGKTFVRCDAIKSVDFVDSPAANPSGLFSVVDSPAKGMAEKSMFEQVKEFVGFSKELTAPVVELESKLKAKETELSTAQSQVLELSKNLAKVETDTAAKIVELEAANKAKIVELEASVEKRASDKALEICKAQGVTPKANTPSSDPNKQNAPELKGFARVQAAIKKELEMSKN